MLECKCTRLLILRRVRMVCSFRNKDRVCWTPPFSYVHLSSNEAEYYTRSATDFETNEDTYLLRPTSLSKPTTLKRILLRTDFWRGISFHWVRWTSFLVEDSCMYRFIRLFFQNFCSPLLTWTRERRPHLGNKTTIVWKEGPMGLRRTRLGRSQFWFVDETSGKGVDQWFPNGLLLNSILGRIP